jgi:DNA-binding XRE family transcriptional regulator
MSGGKRSTRGAGRAPRRDGETKDRPRRGAARPVLSPAQCRAARAILGWTQADLARLAALARKTITDFEANGRSLQFRTRRDITHAFEQAGIEFIWAGSAGEAVEGLRFLRRDQG